MNVPSTRSHGLLMSILSSYRASCCPTEQHTTNDSKQEFPYQVSSTSGRHAGSILLRSVSRVARYLDMSPCDLLGSELASIFTRNILIIDLRTCEPATSFNPHAHKPATHTLSTPPRKSLLTRIAYPDILSCQAHCGSSFRAEYFAREHNS